MSETASERWLRVQNVFSAAVECDTAARVALLDRECGNDTGLRRDVESLLGGHEKSGLVDSLAERINTSANFRERMDALDWQGRTVAQYVVLEALGAGAMGLVYRARDERLGRHVALKFLPPHLSEQPSAKERFLLEARAAAALDHANVCTIHEIGETSDGQLFIAMPLYEGETLQARLERAPLAFDTALSIALQMASGLARAHEQGIIHRDVKPSNVMLLTDGTVKILDFGVARVQDVSLTSPGGAAIGTVAYMSPEQARGDAVDPRTDIWSLGVVLYEMLAGLRPFRGENVQAQILSVLTTEAAPLAPGRNDLPPEIDDVLRRALAKSAEQRYSSMTSMAAELKALAEPVRSTLGARPEAAPASSVAGERRRAAMLVTIVSDYPALIERLAPAELEALIGSVRNAAVDCVRRHGGLVNQALGEEIVSLFGIPTAHEDDDLRAVRAAMELHAQMADVAQASPIRLHSGVHAGLVVAQRLTEGPRRFSVTGPAANVAARLASLAPSGSILISPECQRVLGPFVHTEAHKTVSLLADSAPITPHRVIGESGLQTRLEAAMRKGLTPYAGRHVELAALEARLEEASSGSGQLVLIVGDAGLGKSRLLYEFRERIDAAEVRVVQARCRSYGGFAPYLPFVEVLREVLHLQQEADRGVEVRGIVERILAIDPSLEPFVPLYLHLLSIQSEAHPLPRYLRGEHLQAAMGDALAALLTLAARSRPTILLLEDWHWSDEGSREALRRLMEVASAHALLIVVTTRPQPAGTSEWAAQATRVQLAPLDFPASVAIMRDVLHVQRVADGLARRVFERTSGNPFFLEEICQTLVEQGSVAACDGEGIVAGGVEALQLPDTVQAVIRARLDTLDKEALEVLRVASVIGREFGRELIADATGSGTDPSPALERLKTAGLIQQISVLPALAYRFKHVLTQEVTYDSLLGHQRRGLHETIGRAIERRKAGRIDEHAEVLAYHFERAEDWRLAVRYGRQAADRAGALSQFVDALATLDRVQGWVRQLPDDSDRCDLQVDVLLQQERLCETLGQRRRQQQIIDEVIELLAPRGASARLVQAYLRQGDLATLLKRFDAGDRALSTALRLCRESGDAALECHALRSIGLLRWHEGRHAEARAIIEHALAIDRERGDESAIAGDLANLGSILRSMGDHARALATLEEAMELPSIAQDPAALVHVLHNLANVYRVLGDLDRALIHLNRAHDVSLQSMLPIQRCFQLMSIAHILLQRDQVAESIRTYEEAVELSRRARHADGLVQSLRALGQLLYGLDRQDEALPRLQEAARLFTQLEDQAGEVEMLGRVAVILESQSRAREAAAAWEHVSRLYAGLENAHGELQALEGIVRMQRRAAVCADEILPHARAALALASTLGEKSREAALRNMLGILEWESGRYTLALPHYEALLALARELGDRFGEGLALNSLGVTLSRLSRYDEARTVLEESILLNRDGGEKRLQAHALEALADVCRASGRADAASDCVEQAQALRRALEIKE
jgi:class 3 adenylate cyclase/tetratricopeptide (TPR) repeat protein